MGNARRQRRLRALDEPGEAAIVDARAALGDVLEHAHHGVGERRAAACRKELADLVHRAAFPGRRQQRARLELPHEVRGADGIGVEGETIALFEIRTDRRNLQISD